MGIVCKNKNQFYNFALQKIYFRILEMANKEKSGLEIIENAEALQKEFGKAEGFVKNNQKLFGIIGGVILVGILAYFGYKYYNDSQEKEAQAAMYDAVFSFEADSLKQALNGAGGNAGLLSIADDYSSTKTGKLASFYAGIALLKQGKFDDAITRLEAFSSDDLVLQGKAYALTGDAYMEKKKFEDAVASYKKASEYKPNKFLTPAYLIKLAGAYEAAKNSQGAIEAYTEVIEKFPASTEVGYAKKYKSRLEAENGK